MDSEFFLKPSAAIEGFESFAALREYFGILSIYEPQLKSMVERYNGLNLHAHFQSGAPKKAADEQKEPVLYRTTPQGIALMAIQGPMMKYVSSLGDGTSTVRMRQMLRTARRDTQVLGAILMSDTPGGTVRGNTDLVNEVAAFAAEKPIYGYVEDMTASAGVSVLSQTTKRYANNATALYGAMGTYSVLVDYSQEAEQLGIKVHVIKAGEFKGMGEPGTEITEDQLREAQRIVNTMNENYLNLIARGTKLPLEVVRSLADGRIIMAADAAAAGLIDGVQSFEETYAQLVAATRTDTPKPPASRSKKMDSKTPATLADLKAKFPNSTAEWRESQIEAGADISEAAVAYAAFVEKKAQADKQAHEEALATEKKRADEAIEAAKTQQNSKGSLGHRPLTARKADSQEGQDAESGDPVADFNAKVAKLAGPNPDLGRRQRAIRQVANEEPELYAAYMLAMNPGRRHQRMITEKLESVLGE